MQDILIILACIGAGMACGAGLKARPGLLRLADRLSLCAVYVLLFVLGARLGADAGLLASLPVLGLRAAGIALGCILGSVLCLKAAAAWLPVLPEARRPEAPSGPSPLWGTARILGAFVSGIVLACFSLLPAWVGNGGLVSQALYLLVFLVGIGLGADLRAFRVLRDMRLAIAAVPLLIVLGTLIGSLAAAALLPGMSAREAVTVGLGFGYYSLSSLLIEKAGQPALASVALLANILREVLAILLAPLLVRLFGRLAPVGAAGATAMDTGLPVIARFCGEQYAVIAVFSGMTLTLLVPFLVTFALGK